MTVVPLPFVPSCARLLDARCAGPLFERDAIAQPLAPGLTYFATDTEKLYLWDGHYWHEFVHASDVDNLRDMVIALAARVSALGG